MFGVDGLWWKLIVITLISLTIHRIGSFVRFAGFHKVIYNHAPGPCNYVQGIEEGSEDIQMVYGSLALITTGMRFVESYHSKEPMWMNRKGFIKIFDFDYPEQGAETVKIEGDFNTATLNPHGLSVWEDKADGKIFVFVVNHLPENKDAIERFEFLPETKVLKHLETVTGKEHIYIVNDIVAVGPDSFYFTNYLYNVEYRYEMLEIWTQMRWGTVAYYDGHSKTTQIVADNLMLPNGINVSPDGKVLYVAVVVDRSIRAYKINSDHSLKPLQDLLIFTSPDNLDVQGQYVMAGAHAVIYKSMESINKDISLPSPSQVLRFTIDEVGRLVNMTEVYMDDGTTLSGASCAVHYKGKQLLIGTVNTKALYCTTPGLVV